mmetsp:Transcript_14462/g.31737  ORF Transcript_14462/g.31737 Transcript_14462/m.31737 type:complete len:80 (-) Transcript_14462:162-401(-)
MRKWSLMSMHEALANPWVRTEFKKRPNKITLTSPTHHSFPQLYIMEVALYATISCKRIPMECRATQSRHWRVSRAAAFT